MNLQTKPKGFNYWATLEHGEAYHIYNHAVGNDNLFREKENYNFFLHKWQLYFGNYMDVYAYCLMPNHFHILGRFKILTPEIYEAIRLEDTKKAKAFLAGKVPLNVFYESQFKRFFNSYSRSYGNRYGRIGSLFRAKFKRIKITNQYKLKEKLLYIHHNPIHHKFSDNYNEWPYSSYHEYIYKRNQRVFLPFLNNFNNDKDVKIQLQKFKTAHEVYRKNFTKRKE